MSLFEAKIPFLQYVWTETGERDSHGNKVGSYSNPIERFAISLYPASSTISRSDMVNPTAVVRTETDIFLFVDDASIFGPMDKVSIFDVMFKVQGQPKWGTYDFMPFDGYADLVPDTLHIRRVT